MRFGYARHRRQTPMTVSLSILVCAAGFAIYRLMDRSFLPWWEVMVLVVLVWGAITAYEYWRRPAEARLPPAATIGVSIATLATIVGAVIFGPRRTHAGSVLGVVALLAVAVGPVSLLVSAISHLSRSRDRSAR